MKTFYSVVALVLTIVADVCSVQLTSREVTSCAYLINQIYCVGGYIYGEPKFSEIVMLDISQNGVKHLQHLNSEWVILNDKQHTNIDFDFRAFPQAVALSDGKSLLIQGGYNYIRSSLVDQSIVYNAETRSWSKLPNYYDKNNGGNRQIFYGSGVMLHDMNAVGFYGGNQQHVQFNADYITPNGTRIPNFTYEDESNFTCSFAGFYYFTLFDLNTNNWVVPQQNNPSFKDFTLQSATFHPRTKKIFYLGGQFSDYNSATLIRYPFTHAITFDTAKGQWDEEAIRGLDYPTLRLSHTATLLPDGENILLYGGSIDDSGTAALDYSYILNVPEMKWTLLDLKAPKGLSAARSYHSAVLVNNISLFLLFGLDQTGNALNDILILDVRNVNNITFEEKYPFVLDTTITNDKNNTTSSVHPTQLTVQDASRETNGATLSTGAIAGIAAAVGILCVLSIIAIVLFIRKNKKQENHPMLEVDWDIIEDKYYKENSPPHEQLDSSVKDLPKTSAAIAISPDVSSLTKPDASLSVPIILPDATVIISPNINCSKEEIEQEEAESANRV